MTRSRGIGRPKGMAAVALLQERELTRRGGNDRKPDPALDRSAPDALPWWRDAYEQHLAARNYAPSTIRGRHKTINLFLIWAADRELMRASQITRPILETYQRWLWRYVQPSGKKLSWHTQQVKLSTLKDWFRWMTRQNVIMHNPASELELPRAEYRLPVIGMTRSQVAALLAVPDVLGPLGVRDRAMLEVFYSTGLRRTELCRLELPDFNAERHTLFVRQGKGHKDRVVPLGEQAVAWLKKYIEDVRPRLSLDTRTQAIFLTGYGGPFNPDVVSRMVSAWMRQAGTKGSCHLLRHTCATHMLEGGADIRYIQQLLGHNSLETTSIYTQVTILQLQEVHSRCHPSARLANVTENPSQ